MKHNLLLCTFLQQTAVFDKSETGCYGPPVAADSFYSVLSFQEQVSRPQTANHLHARYDKQVPGCDVRGRVMTVNENQIFQNIRHTRSPSSQDLQYA